LRVLMGAVHTGRHYREAWMPRTCWATTKFAIRPVRAGFRENRPARKRIRPNIRMRKSAGPRGRGGFNREHNDLVVWTRSLHESALTKCWTRKHVVAPRTGRAGAGATDRLDETAHQRCGGADSDGKGRKGPPRHEGILAQRGIALLRVSRRRRANL